jgi:hypothetical protein
MLGDPPLALTFASYPRERPTAGRGDLSQVVFGVRSPLAATVMAVQAALEG